MLLYHSAKHCECSSGGSIWASEDYGTRKATTGHVADFCGSVDSLSDSLHCEIESHEFDNWLETIHSSTTTDSGKSIFRDGSVNHTLGAKSFEKSLGDFVGTFVSTNLLA